MKRFGENLLNLLLRPNRRARNESLGLDRDEQVLGESPFNIHPLLHTFKAGAPGHLWGLVPRILMTALCPDGLVGAEREAGIFDGHYLGFNGAEMHLDPALSCVVEGDMLKSG
jgi:hypothetical protein